MRYWNERGNFSSRGKCIALLVGRRRGELIRDAGVTGAGDSHVGGVGL